MRAIIVSAALLLIASVSMHAQDDKKVRDRSHDAIEELESGKLTLRFFNALTGRPVKGGHVSLKDIGDFVTDFDGKVVFEPPPEDGELAVAFRAPGFISAEFGVEVMNGSPILDIHQIRMVLDWGEEPRDLDLHFVKEGGYHISFRDMHTLSDGTGTLDRDDTHGYGPETITVREIGGTNRYECYVHNYSDRNDPESNALAHSRATVKLYGEGRLLRVFQAPRNVEGTTWHVFDFVDGSVHEQGTITP